ncbi:hypothetical protein ABW19_dt0209814 [Dactylella cylindrospora]|nr:hypothetical protein ABW19_dt0209814 [Dactylella cylindrospora]
MRRLRGLLAITALIGPGVASPSGTVIVITEAPDPTLTVYSLSGASTTTSTSTAVLTIGLVATETVAVVQETTTTAEVTTGVSIENNGPSTVLVNSGPAVGTPDASPPASDFPFVAVLGEADPFPFNASEPMESDVIAVIGGVDSDQANHNESPAPQPIAITNGTLDSPLPIVEDIEKRQEITQSSRYHEYFVKHYHDRSFYDVDKRNNNQHHYGRHISHRNHYINHHDMAKLINGLHRH